MGLPNSLTRAARRHFRTLPKVARGDFRTKIPMAQVGQRDIFAGSCRPRGGIYGLTTGARAAESKPCPNDFLTKSRGGEP